MDYHTIAIRVLQAVRHRLADSSFLERHRFAPKDFTRRRKLPFSSVVLPLGPEPVEGPQGPEPAEGAEVSGHCRAPVGLFARIRLPRPRAALVAALLA